jgi:hypothetical protein
MRRGPRSYRRMEDERFPGPSQLADSKMRHRARRDIDDI